MDNDIKALTDLLEGLSHLRTIFAKQDKTQLVEQIDKEIKQTYEKIKAFEQKQ